MVRFDPGILDEIRSSVSEAVGRFGVAGSVEIHDHRVSLVGHGSTVSTELGPWAAQWDTLTPDMRSRRCGEIARELARQRRAASTSLVAKRRGFSLPDWVAPLVILLTGASAVYGAWRFYPTFLASSAPESSKSVTSRASLDAYERERRERAERVCDATRSRVLRGAAVSPADVEGWVVELSLLTRETHPLPALHPALEVFFARNPGGADRHLVWPAVPDLKAKRGPDTSVAIKEASLPDPRAPRWGGVRAIFTGRYVTPFFQPKERAEYIRLASGIADAMGADYAALYARCAHRDSHHLGAWFYGPSPGGAVASLLYFMGTYADVPHVKASELHPEAAGVTDRVFSLGRLIAATTALDKRRVSTLLGPHGGMIAGEDEKPSTITFPFRDANRADRASRGVARELGIGLDQ